MLPGSAESPDRRQTLSAGLPLLLRFAILSGCGAAQYWVVSKHSRLEQQPLSFTGVIQRCLASLDLMVLFHCCPQSKQCLFLLLLVLHAGYRGPLPGFGGLGDGVHEQRQRAAGMGGCMDPASLREPAGQFSCMHDMHGPAAAAAAACGGTQGVMESNTSRPLQPEGTLLAAAQSQQHSSQQQQQQQQQQQSGIAALEGHMQGTDAAAAQEAMGLAEVAWQQQQQLSTGLGTMSTAGTGAAGGDLLSEPGWQLLQTAQQEVLKLQTALNALSLENMQLQNCLSSTQQKLQE